MNSLVKSSKLFPEAFPSIFSADPWDTFMDCFMQTPWRPKEASVPYDIVEGKNDKGIVTCVTLKFSLAGYSQEDVKVTLDQDQVAVDVNKIEQEEQTNENIVHRGIARRSFHMSYYVPDVDPEKVKASFKNGELVITLPVKQEVEDE